MSGTRLFFTLCLLASGVVLGALYGSSAAPPSMSAEAAAGWTIWRATGCEGCHTLYGQGAPFAPDLTHSYDQRGPEYLREFLANPAAFHPGQRIMPSFGLTVSETDNLLAFLEWVGQQDAAQDWPPRPILVRGETPLLPEAGGGTSDTETLVDDPVTRGANWFKRPPAICSTCHSLEPDVVIVGPSLAGIASRAATRVPGQDAAEYIRNSILHPGDYVVEGFPDAMQRNLGDKLTGEQINDIIAFLLTLE